MHYSNPTAFRDSPLPPDGRAAEGRNLLAPTILAARRTYPAGRKGTVTKSRSVAGATFWAFCAVAFGLFHTPWPQSRSGVPVRSGDPWPMQIRFKRLD